MFKVLKFIVISVVCLIIMGASVLYGFSSLFAPPNMDETLIPDAASQFYDINGNAIYTTLSEERRIPVTIDKIPKHVQRAFIAIEDNRFYEHGGIDYRGTARALLSTLSGHEVQGGQYPFTPEPGKRMLSLPRNVPSSVKLRKLLSLRSLSTNILRMKSSLCI